MPRILNLALAITLAFAMVACTQQEAEISTNDQVPADQREAEPAEGEDGGDAAPAEADTETTWVAEDVDYSEAETELSAGAIAITLDNQGNLPHDITIEETGDKVVADGGETVTEVIELEPGTYTFFCSVPGHRGTMEETVEVS